MGKLVNVREHIPSAKFKLSLSMIYGLVAAACFVLSVCLFLMSNNATDGTSFNGVAGLALVGGLIFAYLAWADGSYDSSKKEYSHSAAETEAAGAEEEAQPGDVIETVLPSGDKTEEEAETEEEDPPIVFDENVRVTF